MFKHSEYERVELTTPDGGTIYCDRYANPSTPIPGKPWHLVTCGKNFESPESAQLWVNQNWNAPMPPIDMTYARAEASFGELP